MKTPCVYILTNRRNGTLYVGVTSDPSRRIEAHKSGAVKGFTEQHALHSLVWIEPHPTMESAIKREKQMKKWNRRWKITAIETQNPEWKDLSDTLI